MANNDNKGKDDADARFTEAVMKFAEAFFALTEEERKELQGYTERQALEAQMEYMESVDKVPDEVIDSVLERFKKDRSQTNFNETFMYALNGNVHCQEQVGYAYFKGLGVEQDFAKAIKWFTKAAEKGSVNAQCGLGVIYESGIGQEVNIKNAVYWYKKAAAQGDAFAKKRLAILEK